VSQSDAATFTTDTYNPPGFNTGLEIRLELASFLQNLANVRLFEAFFFFVFAENWNAKCTFCAE
jgi:hypothetical protein